MPKVLMIVVLFGPGQPMSTQIVSANQCQMAQEEIRHCHKQVHGFSCHQDPNISIRCVSLGVK